MDNYGDSLENELLSSLMLLVLTHAGGVGIAATQLCQTVPDVTIFGTASASKHETIAQGGVTHPIDYRTRDYVEEIRKISPNGEETPSFISTPLIACGNYKIIKQLCLLSVGVDIVLDPLGGSDTQKGFSLLKPLGTLIIFGKIIQTLIIQMSANQLIKSNISCIHPIKSFRYEVVCPVISLHDPRCS